MQTVLAIAAIIIAAFLALKLVIVLFHLLHWLFVIAATVIWILAIVDILRREFSSTTNKVLWFVFVLLTQFIGAVVYFLFGRSTGRLASRI